MVATHDFFGTESMGRESSHTLRVLLVDDHPMYLHGMRTFLSTLSDTEVVGEAHSGEQALTLADDLQPNLIIMDLQLPEMNGIEATRRIKQRNPHMKVLVMTMFEDDQSVYGAIQAGAQGYVLKDADADEMVRAVRGVSHGEAIFSPNTASKLLRRLIEVGASPSEERDRQALTNANGTKWPEQDGSVQHFGPLLRRHRRAQSLTQEELAERAGLSHRTVSDLERGVYARPHRDTVHLLAEALQLSPDDKAAFVAAARQTAAASRESTRVRTDRPTAVLAPCILTFLVADMRGYTRFTQEHGDEAAAELALRFERLTEETVEPWVGRVVETRGDEVLVAFPSARRALQAAAALQMRLASIRAAGSLPILEAGIGLDAGEAIPVPGGYRGGSLNLAARLCAAAGPGEVLCSEAVVHLARKTEGIVTEDRGAMDLKGLSTSVRVIQVAPEGMRVGDRQAPNEHSLPSR